MMAEMRARRLRRGAAMTLAVLIAAAGSASPGAAAPEKETKAVKGQAGRDSLAGTAAPTPNTTVKLIEILIQNGVLTRAQAQALLKQAEEEAAAARQPPPSQPQPQAAAAVPPAVIQAPAAPAGTVRVPYVPETVKKQIKEELREEVVQQAKSEGWAEPNTVPEWVNRIRLSGDVRGRFEQDLLDKDNTTGIADFNEINDGNPLQVNLAAPFEPIPTLNTTDDRTRYRLRGRVGLDAQIDDWVSAGVRLATGSDQSPVSTNQTLGGGDGEFSKYNIWLDRAFIELTPTEWLTGYVGRMPNPFWTSDLLFDTDLNFDGAAAQLTHRFGDRTSVFLNAGGFPVFNTDFDFPETSTDKVRSRDKYLLAAQAGVDHRIDNDYKVRGAVGFFDFENLNGKFSDPCPAFSADVECNTDQSRPLFVQKGNSLFGIRRFDTLPTPTTPQFQYFGLAPEYGVLDLRGRLDISTYDPLHIALEANFLKNLLFDHKEINSKEPSTNLSGDGKWEGGDMGFMVQATVGDERVDELWKWNVSLAYKYLESDAVPDAFTDSDFHLGGTNAKGYILGGNLGVAKNTYLSLRWLSADEVSGPPLAIDVLQLDLNTSF